MTIARSRTVAEGQAGCYHLISRCVRRAFLCGDAAEHRRDWIAHGLEAQAETFAIEVLAYSVMANHLHLVVRVNPFLAMSWDDLSVTQRWAALFPHSDKDGNEVPWSPEEIEHQAQNLAWVLEIRKRLTSVSWFMKILKERVARRANREDNCTGHFWEGRFTSVRLLDQAAVIACMAYVDLNPIRAAIAKTPEDSAYTSIQLRITTRQTAARLAALAVSVPAAAPPSAPSAEDGLWLSPLSRCSCPPPEGAAALFPLSLDEYLELVDATGRIVKSGKRGSIPAHLLPILTRLKIDAERWVDLMLRKEGFWGTAIGSALNRAAEAARRGVKWIAEKICIHAPEVAT